MAICGVTATNLGRPVERGEIERMLSVLSLGPDRSSNISCGREAGFGLTSSSTAEIWSTDRIVAVCDADLYNVDDLKGGLHATWEMPNLAALLAALYLENGAEFISKLRGAFAFAIWDKALSLLLLAVDRFRIKPLCYAVGKGDLVFASQPRALFASLRVQKSVDPQSIVQYLNFTAVPAPNTVYDGVKKLPQGTCLLWESGKVKTVRYWHMTYPEDLHASKRRLANELLSRMEESVRLTSRDIPASKLGCFLSGGTDSSSITGLLTQIRQGPVQTFSVGFSEERFDELAYARIAARHFGSNHVQLVLGPTEVLRTIPSIVSTYDEPFGNASALPTYHCQALARKHGIEVMLAGDGGDELFAGNERYCTDQIYQFYQRIPALVRRKLIEPLAFGFPISVEAVRKVQRYIRRANTGHPERYCAWLLLKYFNPEQILESGMLLHNGDSDLLAVPRALYHAAPARSELNRLLYVDAQMTLGDNDLPKVVRTAELAGMRVRFPYLDHCLAEFSGRLPVHLKLRGFRKRYLFKQATRRLLPREVLHKKKHGFGLPIGLWLRGDPKMREMAEEVLLDPRTYQRGYFRRSFIEQLFHLMDKDNKTYFGDLLWLFIMLELWHRHHVEGKAT